jgi:hypothetical protein
VDSGMLVMMIVFTTRCDLYSIFLIACTGESSRLPEGSCRAEVYLESEESSSAVTDLHTRCIHGLRWMKGFLLS